MRTHRQHLSVRMEPTANLDAQMRELKTAPRLGSEGETAGAESAKACRKRTQGFKSKGCFGWVLPFACDVASLQR